MPECRKTGIPASQRAERPAQQMAALTRGRGPDEAGRSLRAQWRVTSDERGALTRLEWAEEREERATVGPDRRAGRSGVAAVRKARLWIAPLVPSGLGPDEAAPHCDCGIS
jgi:hypothetical protein